MRNRIFDYFRRMTAYMITDIFTIDKWSRSLLYESATPLFISNNIFIYKIEYVNFVELLLLSLKKVVCFSIYNMDRVFIIRNNVAYIILNYR